jgi:hypothetical protein
MSATTESSIRIRRAVEGGAAAAAIEHDCATIKWQVAEWNADARRFYERLGAAAAHEWG